MVNWRTTHRVWQLLDEVHDPELPTLSVVELGMIRSLGMKEDRLIISLTPTFSACPAISMIKQEITSKLAEAGYNAEIRISHYPPWSSDWISAQGREKLKAFGIAPPPLHQGTLEETLAQPAACPHCDSQETILKNDFGSTLCRAIYFCQTCRQPFELFKPM